MPEPERIVYVCEICFAMSDTTLAHHGRPMVRCEIGQPGDDSTKPVMDEAGRLLTHAPKWWVYRHQRAGSSAAAA
jgi:hypothetical protein